MWQADRAREETIAQYKAELAVVREAAAAAEEEATKLKAEATSQEKAAREAAATAAAKTREKAALEQAVCLSKTEPQSTQDFGSTRLCPNAAVRLHIPPTHGNQCCPTHLRWGPAVAGGARAGEGGAASTR